MKNRAMDLVLKTKSINMEEPLLLFSEGDHSIHWLGASDVSAFRTNTYLISDGDQSIVIDPGNRSFFKDIKKNIKKLGRLSNVQALVICHQDPDVAASIVDWLKFKPELEIIASARTNILLPHYGISDYSFYDTGESNNNEYVFKSGRKLKFIEAPFMHFPGAIASYDEFSSSLFSGDIWAAISMDFHFTVDDFEEHKLKLDLFHIDYMASGVASRGFAAKLKNIKIELILPQHGAIIQKEYVQNAIEYLEQLKCGLDLIYPGT